MVSISNSDFRLFLCVTSLGIKISIGLIKFVTVFAGVCYIPIQWTMPGVPMDWMLSLRRYKQYSLYQQYIPFIYSDIVLFLLKLLNQFENTGPPPADRERIKSLPTISITEEHVGKSLKRLSPDWSVGSVTFSLSFLLFVLASYRHTCHCNLLIQANPKEYEKETFFASGVKPTADINFLQCFFFLTHISLIIE